MGYLPPFFLRFVFLWSSDWTKLVIKDFERLLPSIRVLAKVSNLTCHVSQQEHYRVWSYFKSLVVILV